MGKAEVGSTKHLNNQMKARGLNRLRWYCQICEKSCRDENGFKMHTQSESHTRKALEAGQNFKGVQEDFSKTFLNEFISLLKSSHGEKEIHANKFYQEVISKRDHTHLNATKWHSLTDFVKYLGRESICRVIEKEDGLFIAWIDDSPEAMKRREAVRRKEMQDKGDEEREQMLLKEQIKRAQRDAAARGITLEEEEAARELKRAEGEKIVLSFGTKPAPAPTPPPGPQVSTTEPDGDNKSDETNKLPAEGTSLKPISLKFGAKPAPKNVFKNALAGAPKKVMAAQPKKMSEAERIMKEEMERKRAREAGGGPPKKRPRM
ncbi:domain of Kin17 curved DNA-binding protein-domain-containing protein [Rhypophila decipiens]|uniref:Domain of Kin17 curved DNA-binding protein-domain-containing protein n=1 Tax=Rhypophila decipiens TaxID=261697 RepID=A0AAN6YAW3_9PEZI|nr:domain of Kin17 curved DNA-binding protein-domain-containing protein [Rhypophila decipiens]